MIIITCATSKEWQKNTDPDILLPPDPQMPLGDPHLTNSALIDGDIHGHLKKIKTEVTH